MPTKITMDAAKIPASAPRDLRPMNRSTGEPSRTELRRAASTLMSRASHYPSHASMKRKLPRAPAALGLRPCIFLDVPSTQSAFVQLM